MMLLQHKAGTGAHQELDQQLGTRKSLLEQRASMTPMLCIHQAHAASQRRMRLLQPQAQMSHINVHVAVCPETQAVQG